MTLGISAKAWSTARMISRANGGLRINAAPQPRAETFFEGQPMFMSTPSKPSSQATWATW